MVTGLRHKHVKRDEGGVTVVTSRHTLPRSSSTCWGDARTPSPRSVTRGAFESDNALDTHALTGGTDEVGCARGDSPRGTDCCSRPSARCSVQRRAREGLCRAVDPSSPHARHRGEREGAEGKGRAPPRGILHFTSYSILPTR